MLKLVKRFEKTFITVVMVLLMITFLMTTGYGRGGNHRNDAVIGTIDGNSLHQSDLAESKAEWQYLKEYVQVVDPLMRQEVPIAASYDYLGPTTFRAINDKPELFMLLVHEARKAPVQVNSDELQTIMQNYYHTPANAEDPDTVDAVTRQGVIDLLLIKQNFSRIADAIKVSQPQREQVLAQYFQKIKLKLIELTADEFATRVPQPDQKAIQQQFDQFYNTAPGVPVEGSNPFGFGYRLPDRVKLQYIWIDRGEVEKAVEATKSAYDWDVAARLYWLRHPSEFPTTQPAASAQMGPTAPTTKPAAEAAAPGVRPYDQVKDEALHSVRDPLVDKLALEVQGQVIAGLSADTRNAATTAPSERQASAALDQIVASVQSQYHVKIFSTDLSHTFHSEQQLASGTVVGAIADASLGNIPFAQAVMQQASSFIAPADKANPPPRSFLMTPSAPLTDFARNVYIFRILDAKAAEPAPSVDEAMAEIVSDLRTKEEYEAAKAAGQGLINSAHSRPLEQVAKSAGKPLMTTDWFNLESPDPGVAIALPQESRRSFLQQSFRLLATYKPGSDAHPLGLIELQPDHRLFVAQLADVTPDWRGTHYDDDYVEVAKELKLTESLDLRQRWMDYDAVVARLKYKASEKT